MIRRPYLSRPMQTVLTCLAFFYISTASLRAQAAVPPATTSSDNESHSLTDQAYIEFLRAWRTAEAGGHAEALATLARSLKLQQQNAPAADLAFQQLVSQRSPAHLTLHGHTGSILATAYSRDGKKILTSSSDHTVRIWNAADGKLLTPPLQHHDDVTAIAFSQDGRYVATGSGESVQVWDAESGKAIGTAMKTLDEPVTLAFSPDDKLLATGTEEGRLDAWNWSTGEPLFPFVKYHEGVNTVQFSPDGTHLLASTGDDLSDQIDPRTGKRLNAPMRQSNIAFNGEYSEDGKLIVTSNHGGLAMLWNAATGMKTGISFKHAASIPVTRFSPDARRVVTASFDHTARVWSTTTGEAITSSLEHGSIVQDARFNYDGKLVATLAGDKIVRVWDAKTGELVLAPIKTKAGVTSMAFSPVANSLLVASVDGSVEIYDMPPQENAPAWISLLTQYAASRTKYNQSIKVDLNAVRQLRTELLSSKEMDAWSRFGRWYFTEDDVLPVSPWSTFTMSDYIDALVAQGDWESLDYAINLSRQNPVWMKKAVAARKKLPPQAVKPATKEDKD